MSTLLQGPRGNCGSIVYLSCYAAFCGPKNEKYLSGFDVMDLNEALRSYETILVVLSLILVSDFFVLFLYVCSSRQSCL